MPEQCCPREAAPGLHLFDGDGGGVGVALMQDMDPGPMCGWLRLSGELRHVPVREADRTFHAAVDAVLLAYVTARRWHLVLALLWVAWRAGIVVGRRQR